jgi:Spy/CpxP family protein refolding chaperone
MDIRSKSALAVLALALSCSPILAQDDPPGPLAERQASPDGFGPRGHMRQMGPMERREGWGDMRGGWGQGGGMGMRGPGRERGEFGLSRVLNDPDVREKLGVTTEQVAKIRQQESDFRKAEIRNRADLEVKRIDLNDLLAVDKPDRAAIDSKLQEISAAQLTLEKARVGNRLDMRDALTPEQRQKLRDLMNERRQRGDRSGPRGPQGARRAGGQRGPAPPSNSNPQGQAPPSH